MRAIDFITEQQSQGFYTVGDSTAHNLGKAGPWQSFGQPGSNSSSFIHKSGIDRIPEGSVVAIALGADDATGTSDGPEQIASRVSALVDQAISRKLKFVFVLFPANVSQDIERNQQVRSAIETAISNKAPILDMQSSSGQAAGYPAISAQILAQFGSAIAVRAPATTSSPSTASSTSLSKNVDADIYNKLKPFVAPDKRGAGLQGLQPSFAQALYNMITSAPANIGKQIQVFSGFRSEERQKQLWAGALRKYGSVAAARRWVAPPTGVAGSQGSRHNWGVAADLKFGSPAAQKWVHANCSKFGLGFRMGHEKWHIEPTDQSVIASAKSNWLSKFA